MIDPQDAPVEYDNVPGVRGGVNRGSASTHITNDTMLALDRRDSNLQLASGKDAAYTIKKQTNS